MMEFYLNFFLFLFTFLGGLLHLIIPSWNSRYSRNILSFSGAFLFAVCVSHILPDSFRGAEPHLAGILVIAGFFLQFVLQRLTHGVEHGHDCKHHHNDATAWSLFGGMAIHSLVEGLPLSAGFFEIDTLIPLYLAILLHKIPSAIIIIGMFAHSTAKIRSYLILGLFSLVTPLGATIGYWIDMYVPGFHKGLHWIIPVVAGSFLQIATTIFYETSGGNHRLSDRNWILILLGALAGMSSGYFHIH